MLRKRLLCRTLWNDGFGQKLKRIDMRDSLSSWDVSDYDCFTAAFGNGCDGWIPYT